MTTTTVRSRLLLVSVCLGLVLPAAGFAQQQCGIKRDVQAKGFQNEAVYKRLSKIYEDIGNSQYSKAHGELTELVGRTSNDYEKAVVHQALAQVEWQRERHDASLRNFEAAVKLDSLPDKQHFALMKQIAQLYSMKGRYREALARLEDWFCVTPADQIEGAAYVLKASILAELNRHREALVAIDKAISIESKPNRNWYSFKLGMHMELEQYPQAASTLEKMINYWPENKDYWVQLSTIYGRLKQHDKSLSVLALAHRNGMLVKSMDIRQLAGLYSQQEIPYKAAETLQKGIEAGIVEGSKSMWEQVAGSWYQAEELENSLSAYEKAGRASTDGKLDLRRGFILIDLERWADAKQALTAAISKGGLESKKVGDAYLLRGMSEFNLGNFGPAEGDWNKALGYANTANAAQQWLKHLSQQRKQVAQK